MTDTASTAASTTGDSLRRPIPALLLRVSVVLGALFIGFALTLDGPEYLLRVDLLTGTVVAATGGYVLTRLGRGERVTALFTVLGLFVSVWLLVMTALNRLRSPLSHVTIVLGLCTVLLFGLLYRSATREA